MTSWKALTDYRETMKWKAVLPDLDCDCDQCNLDQFCAKAWLFTAKVNSNHVSTRIFRSPNGYSFNLGACEYEKPTLSLAQFAVEAYWYRQLED
jgi:hypothetical protein